MEFTFRHINIRRKDPTFGALGMTLLRPKELAQLSRDSNADTPLGLVHHLVFIMEIAVLYDNLVVRSIEVDTMHTEAFAIAKVELVRLLVDDALLGCVYQAWLQKSLHVGAILFA